MYFAAEEKRGGAINTSSLSWKRALVLRFRAGLVLGFG